MKSCQQLRSTLGHIYLPVLAVRVLADEAPSSCNLALNLHLLWLSYLVNFMMLGKPPFLNFVLGALRCAPVFPVDSSDPAIGLLKELRRD